jgi:glycosyltransferase involved in cell wall biosynthesis
MKFTVLVPTRNRLAYLKNALETVRRQDYDDWEIIVSDNFSDEDIGGYVASLDDPRVKYSRTDRFVPVTENWNNALGRSTGDYVVMLGDDDGLMPGYFRTALGLIEQFGQPEVIYTGAYLYGYPQSTNEHPEGFLRSYGYASFLQGAREPYLLGREEASKVARQALDFRLTYGYNMQFALVERGFIGSFAGKGPFYQGPFPDYYAMNVMFLKASRILVVPEPLVVIGISPKSYGSFLNKKVESEGVKFLEARAEVPVDPGLEDVVLPGTNINTSSLYTVVVIRKNYGDELGLKVNYDRYRLLQIVHMYKRYYMDRDLPEAEFDLLRRKMRLRERVVYGGGLRAISMALHVIESNTVARALWRRVFPSRDPRWTANSLEGKLGQFIRFDPEWSDLKCKDLVEVFEKMEPART